MRAACGRGSLFRRLVIPGHPEQDLAFAWEQTICLSLHERLFARLGVNRSEGKSPILFLFFPRLYSLLLSHPCLQHLQQDVVSQILNLAASAGNVGRGMKQSCDEPLSGK